MFEIDALAFSISIGHASNLSAIGLQRFSFLQLQSNFRAPDIA
jgi:hypothetical protein